MASIKERSLGVARLYAKAMLTAAQEQGAAESLGEELEGLLEQVRRDEDFALFLSSPVLERDKRRESLETMLRGRASDLLVDSLQVVNKKGRLSILDQILEAYREAFRESSGQIEVKIATAVPLSDEQRGRIRERASISMGKQASLVEVVDPELLGGLVVQIEDQKVDMSVRRDLQLLSARFAERLSTEILGEAGFAIEGDVTVGEAGATQDGRDEQE